RCTPHPALAPCRPHPLPPSSPTRRSSDLGHLPVVVVVPTAVQPEVPDASDVGQNRAVRTTRVRCLLGHRHVRVRLLKRPPASCADVVSPERTSTILLAGNFSRNRPNALCHRYDATCFP